MNRILVIRGGAIGDFILTLPAVKLLRARFPQSHLEILGYKHIVALAENRFYANATRSLEYAPLARFFVKNADLPQELIRYFGNFDLIVSYLFDPDKIFEGNVRRCGEIKFLAGPSKPGSTSPAALQLAAPMLSLDLRLESTAAEVFPSSADRMHAREFLSASCQSAISIHPGSGSETKNWPLDRWLALSLELLGRIPNNFLIVLGGEADRRQVQLLRDRLPPGRVQFAEDFPLPIVAAIAESCALFIGHDSGISHLAAAVGTPALLLFGPTEAQVWAPANANVRVLQAANRQMSGLPVEEVVRAAHELMRIGIKT